MTDIIDGFFKVGTAIMGVMVIVGVVSILSVMVNWIARRLG